MAMRRPLRGEVRESSAVAARRVSPHHLDRVGPPYQLRKEVVVFGHNQRCNHGLRRWAAAAGSPNIAATRRQHQDGLGRALEAPTPTEEKKQEESVQSGLRVGLVGLSQNAAALRRRCVG